MSRLFWISILIILFAVFIFVIVPSMQPSIIYAAPMGATAQRPAGPAGPAPRKIDELAAYYTPASECVAEDHPRRAIGACPESKPMSTALPITNIPLCVARTMGPVSVSV